ncbi:P-loop NTPase fold protein [Mucilaginibacter aquariorum]|uniref:P-loop NTPase fold protein n=1 Tax=Mucilaginibacter aquariorum TaxID=2967225 RepID=A0ABT1T782_9SPHI|nr:P-loop NTPase fold protein [Mucilaginibacter aquariorum]MCQ6960480.1 P-loop NTPase fold protein [Mucilaginibacter aquariorum]
MKKNSLTYIDQESVKSDFKYHLDNEANSRILFSARFGTGKSTFLNNFFSQSNNEYITLKLYPVNYSISHNKDVFELIKYDLIYELLSKYPEKVDLQKNEYSSALVAQMFLLHGLKIEPLLKSILKASAPESEVYTDIVNQLSGIVKQYSNYKEDVEKNELDILNRYINQLKSYKGTAHEYDEVSEVITSMLSNVKRSLMNDSDDKSVKTVLIIDDIDRLDPEHVFRLFNIFSAHYDSVTEENKFSFDKVVFVCDYNNIRLMYEHRYGKGVDFSGYIDKFFSTELFNYDNRKYVKSRIREILINKPQGIPEDLLTTYSAFSNSSFYRAFEHILLCLFNINAITLRNLEQFTCYDTPSYSFSAGSNQYPFKAKEYPFLVLTHLLKRLYDVNSLEHFFKILSKKNEIDISLNADFTSEPQIRYLKEICLDFLVDNKIIFSSEPVGDLEAKGMIVLNEKAVYYKLDRNSSSRMRYPILSNAERNQTITQLKEQTNVFEFLLEALAKTENLVIL